MAELEAQLLAGAAAQSTQDTYGLDLYGFADFTYTRLLADKFDTPPWDSFAVGRLNLYASGELGDGWRSLFEIRYTYLPNGAPQQAPPGVAVSRRSTQVFDYVDFRRVVRWGGIIIERAWLEHTVVPELSIRVGNWLTPYGIWNVDHGSPVIVGVRRPYIVGEEHLPQYQTGLQVHGFHNYEWLRVGYHLTLSNGRGPLDTYQDLNGNKGVGGRVFLTADTDYGMFTFGSSWYAGTYTDREELFAIDAEGNAVTERPATFQFDEASLSVDFKWQWGGLLIQGEASGNDVAFDDATRPLNFFSPGAGYVADYRRYGAYGLAGYRFDWGGIMPFGGLEYYEPGWGIYGDIGAFWGGINMRPTPRVTLKGQFTHSFLVGEETPDGVGYTGIDLQAAWSF